jgi:hypothetical protein
LKLLMARDFWYKCARANTFGPRCESATVFAYPPESSRIVETFGRRLSITGKILDRTAIPRDRATVAFLSRIEMLREPKSETNLSNSHAFIDLEAH